MVVRTLRNGAARRRGERIGAGHIFHGTVITPTIALTRPVSPTLAECELTHLARVAIDVVRAAEQHAQYETLLRSLGATVVRVAAAPALPDAVFIEDTAVVLDEVAVITRPGAAARRGEVPAVADALARYRPTVRIETPGTLDGGDVIRAGRTLFVGRSSRSNDDGIMQLGRLISAYDYRVVPVEFAGCLHLKSAATLVAEGVVLLNPAWVSPVAFATCETIVVDPHEPSGANALPVDDTLVYGAQFPRTADLLIDNGLRVATVDLRELAKAEGAVTCCSLVLQSLTPSTSSFAKASSNE